MNVVFALAKELSLELREEELVGTFAGALRSLLPGRRLCLRTIDPRTLQLTALAAEGHLVPGAAMSPLEVKRSALARTHLPESVTGARLQLVERYQTIFSDTQAGFSVPLVASGEIFGLLNIEYPSGSAAHLLAADEQVVIPLANQLSVALRNLNLLGETRYYRDYLRQVIDVANALILVIDRNGMITVMNTTMRRYLGYGDELIGTSVDDMRRDLVAPEPKLGSLMLDGLVGSEHIDVEVMVMKRDRSLGRALFNTSVLRASDGSIDGVMGIGQDRDRVRLLERQVIQAEKLASLGQLAAGVVHELNNPLTSISVYGDFLMQHHERAGHAAEGDKARKIVEGAARIQKLTRDLMTYARPAGEFEEVDLNGVVRQALVFCEHTLDRAEVVIELVLAERLVPVRAIPTQLHQVLINLVTNACHALPAPGQTIRLTTALESDAEHVLVEVTDTGVGIDAADQTRVFEPFFTTKKDGRGTGLGLSIVKNIVEAHGGSIAFHSQAGVGTTFAIRLPAAPPEDY